jgi:3'-5' exoribonuclease
VKRKVKVSDLNPKDQVNEVFLLKYIALMESRDGKKYLSLSFADATGEIEGRGWSSAEQLSAKFQKGDYVLISGKVNLFQGRRQLILAEISKVDPSEVDAEDFISKSDHDPSKMFEELEQIVSSLDDVYIKDLLQSVLADSEIRRRLLVWQAGKSIHHAYQSGLLEHILSCTRLAQALSAHYKVNANYVVAGAILHDICKIYELSSGPNVEYTEEGRLVGHLTKGPEVLDRFSRKIKDFPYQMKLHLKHILLSHHGHFEFGSPKLPSTREALLLHHIDLIDSKMGSFEEVIKTDSFSGHWSGYVKHLDRMVFKADLPHYTDYVSEYQIEAEPAVAPKESEPAKVNKKKAPYKDKELKQNLGSLLEGFKIDE